MASLTSGAGRKYSGVARKHCALGQKNSCKNCRV